MKDGKIIGHIPSSAYWTLKEKCGEGGGCICGKSLDKIKLGKGLEVPSVYKFYGSDCLIQEL